MKILIMASTIRHLPSLGHRAIKSQVFCSMRELEDKNNLRIDLILYLMQCAARLADLDMHA